MKKRIIALLLFLSALAGLLTGCGAAGAVDTASAVNAVDAVDTTETILDRIEAYENAHDPAAGQQEDAGGPEDSPATAENAPEANAPVQPDEPAGADDVPQTEADVSTGEDEQEISSPPLADSAAVTEDGEYSSPEDVAEYIHTFGKLPGNFITKKEAQSLGWDSSKGNLWDVAPGKSIGGDYFGNYEGLLPEGRYHECDVNYAGGYRGAERLIYGEDGSVWYTNDHYESFTQLY